MEMDDTGEWGCIVLLFISLYPFQIRLLQHEVYILAGKRIQKVEKVYYLGTLHRFSVLVIKSLYVNQKFSTGDNDPDYKDIVFDLVSIF